MTHRYVIVRNGTVVRGPDAPEASAMAWAHDTVLAIGSDEEVLGISRGDSSIVDLGGATVVAIAPDTDPTWPTNATLDVGLPASFAVLADDPRSPGGAGHLSVVAVVREGRLVSGVLSGLAAERHDHAP